MDRYANFRDYAKRLNGSLQRIGNTVTGIYIDFDMRNVNAANRKVMDYVLQVGEYAKDSPFSCR